MENYKKLTIEDVERVMNSVPDNPFIYPIDHGNGIYEISKGVFGNKQLSDEVDKELLKLIRE